MHLQVTGANTRRHVHNGDRSSCDWKAAKAFFGSSIPTQSAVVAVCNTAGVQSHHVPMLRILWKGVLSTVGGTRGA